MIRFVELSRTITKEAQDLYNTRETYMGLRSSGYVATMDDVVKANNLFRRFQSLKRALVKNIEDYNDLLQRMKLYAQQALFGIFRAKNKMVTKAELSGYFEIDPMSQGIKIDLQELVFPDIYSDLDTPASLPIDNDFLDEIVEGEFPEPAPKVGTDFDSKMEDNAKHNNARYAAAKDVLTQATEAALAIPRDRYMDTYIKITGNLDQTVLLVERPKQLETLIEKDIRDDLLMYNDIYTALKRHAVSPSVDEKEIQANRTKLKDIAKSVAAKFETVGAVKKALEDRAR